MVTDLILPKRGIILPEIPSYIKFDGAFALGEGAVLGDRSRYRSHGTISGADWATGLHGKCLDFVAASKDYVEIPASHTQLDFTSEKFSIIIRLRIDDLTATRNFFIRGQPNVYGYWLRVASNGKVYFSTHQSGATQSSITAAGTLTTATWYSVGISRDGASVRILRNGVDVSKTIGNHLDPATCNVSAKIGIHNDFSAGPFDGKIEFLRIFGGIALSASEHLAYHNALA